MGRLHYGPRYTDKKFMFLNIMFLNKKTRQ